MADPDVTVQHFAVPFNITASGADVVEQDSSEEIFGCVQNIVACRVGTRVDLPAFGIPYPAFANAPINTAAIGNAIRQWEPRADLILDERGDDIDESIRHVQVGVQVRQ